MGHDNDRRRAVIHLQANESVAAQHRFAPGKRTLTDSVVVQTRETTAPRADVGVSGAAASGQAPRLEPVTSGTRPTLQMLFGVQRAAAAAPGSDPALLHSTAASGVQASNPHRAAAVLAEMGRSFDADFSSVRVIEGSHVSDVGARAFARGDELHFSPGEFRPDTREGRELIGHELAHVVQQAHGRVPAILHGKGAEFNTDPALEREADDWGACAARGDRLAVGRGARAGDNTAGPPHKDISPFL